MSQEMSLNTINTLQVPERMELGTRIVVTKLEEEGLKTLKQYIEDYLSSETLNEDSRSADGRLFLEKAKVDDEFILRFIKGRKNDPFAAWNSLRRYTENRFVFYPEVFPQNGVPDKVRQLVEEQVVGVLKKPDKFGRRITFVDITKWDPNRFSIDDMTKVAVFGAEIFANEPGVLEKGFVLIENTRGFGMAHMKMHSLEKVSRLQSVFVDAFPMRVKGIYYFHMPYIFTLLFKMTKNLFPKRIRKRMFLYSSGQTPTELFEIAPPEILPDWAGGTLPLSEVAEDTSFFESHFNQYMQCR